MSLSPSDDYLQSLVSMLAAIGVGAALGWDREAKNKPAGLRTHVIVSLASAALMALAMALRSSVQSDSHAVQIDPLRMAQGIMSGVGFLGAGTIIHSRGSVEGITTAATIWLASALGIVCGMREYALAITGAVLAILVLWGFQPLERKIGESSRDEDQAAAARAENEKPD